MSENKDGFSLALIQSTAAHMRDLLSRLKADREALDLKISGVEADLNRLERQLKGTGDGSRSRRKRGENLQVVLRLYTSDTDAGFTMQEMAARTGLPLSSIQAVLKKTSDRFKRNAMNNQYFLAQNGDDEKVGAGVTTGD